MNSQLDLTEPRHYNPKLFKGSRPEVDFRDERMRKGITYIVLLLIGILIGSSGVYFGTQLTSKSDNAKGAIVSSTTLANATTASQVYSLCKNLVHVSNYTVRFPTETPGVGNTIATMQLYNGTILIASIGFWPAISIPYNDFMQDNGVATMYKNFTSFDYIMHLFENYNMSVSVQYVGSGSGKNLYQIQLVATP